MAIVFLTFIAAIAVVLGSYWGFVLRPEREAQLQRQARLLAPAPVAPPPSGLVKGTQPRSRVQVLDRTLLRMGDAVDPLERVIGQSGLSITAGTILLASGCLALFAFIVTELVTGTWLVATPAAAVAGGLPFLYLRRARTRRLARLEALFPDALDLIARALRAGHGINVGLSMAGEEMPEPMAQEFRTLFQQQRFGQSLADTLRAFAIRVPLVDVRFFVTAVLTQRESGGNLSEILDNLAGVVRERFKVKRQIRVLSAHGRITGWVLAGLPVVLALALTILDPGHMLQFVRDPIGRGMLLGAITLQAIGGLAIRRIVDVEY